MYIYIYMYIYMYAYIYIYIYIYIHTYTYRLVLVLYLYTPIYTYVYTHTAAGPYGARGRATLLVRHRILAISTSWYIVLSVYLAISCQVLYSSTTDKVLRDILWCLRSCLLFLSVTDKRPYVYIATFIIVTRSSY